MGMFDKILGKEEETNSVEDTYYTLTLIKILIVKVIK